MATLIRKTKSLLVVMAWVPTMFISYSVHGIELDGEFNVGMGSSDNITRTSQAPISDVFTLVGLKLDIVEESRRIRTNVQSQFDPGWSSASSCTLISPANVSFSCNFDAATRACNATWYGTHLVTQTNFTIFAY